MKTTHISKVTKIIKSGKTGSGSSQMSNSGPEVKTREMESDEPVTVDRGPLTGQVITKAEGDRLAKEAGLEPGEEKTNSEEDWKDSARNAAQRHLTPRSRNTGSGAGAIYQRIMELTTPIVNWRQELARIIGRIASSSDFAPWNRREAAKGNYIYALKDRDSGLENAVVALDVSGSVAASFPEFAAEVVGICKAKKIKTVSVLPFANTVVDPFQVRGFRKPTPEDFAKVRTGGGTEAIPDVIDWIDTKLKGRIDFCVIVTDGYLTNGLPTAPKKWGRKTIWLVYDNPTFQIPSEWGRIIHANGDPGYWG